MTPEAGAMLARVAFVAWCAVGTAGACTAVTRRPRPTILSVASPASTAPPPESNEVRLPPVDLAPGAADGSGASDDDAATTPARRALDAHRGAILACYQALLLRAPEAQGAAEVQLDLGVDGRVARVVVDHVGGGGIDGIEACLRERLLGLTVPTARGRYVSRVYRFANPVQRLEVSAPLVIVAPRRAARARVHGGEAPPAQPPPPTAPGALQESEVADGLAPHRERLAGCYATLLRRGRRARGRGTLEFVVSAAGFVPHARFTDVPPALLEASDCVTQVVLAATFRASGSRTTVRQVVRFGR